MTISVVIPCHNAGPYLAQTIGSALSQHRVPDEIIVVDDASTDGSVAIAGRFAAHEPGLVRVWSERYGRASRTRNLGALIARGDALLFLDADDVLHPDALAALETALARGRDGVAVCPWFRLEYLGGRWLQRPSSCTPRLPGEDALSAWLTGWYHPPCSVLWSRSAFEAAGRWDDEITVNDDGDLMMRALARRTPLLAADGGAAYYRRRADGTPSLSESRRSRDAIASRLRVLDKIASWIDDGEEFGARHAALSTAYDLIASDARACAPELHARARAAARGYGASPWRRVRAGAAAVGRRAGQRLRQLPRRGPSAPSEVVAAPGLPPHDHRAVEVDWGLARAEQVMQSGVLQPAQRPQAPNRPVVSVVIPSFNRAHVLPRTLASVRAQTFDAVEILVIDDGSADDTAAVVTACGDPRVRYLRQLRNMGVSAARNRGLREALGDFIAFLDSDDEWMPEKLERQVALFRRLPEHVGLLYTGVQSVRENGTTTIEQPADRGDVHREMLWHNVIHGGGSNVMIRRNVVATIGFFHEGLPAIEDYEYWLRITRAYAVDFVPEPLVRYHDRRDTMRRSLSWRANVDARWWLYRRHAREMRRAGVAHLFLLNTIRWAMNFPGRDLGEVRRLAARAVLDAPTSRMAVAMLLRTMVPAAGRLPWVQRHAALE